MKLSLPLIYDTILPIKISFPLGASAFSSAFPPRGGHPVTMYPSQRTLVALKVSPTQFLPNTNDPRRLYVLYITHYLLSILIGI
jgi:hypothetical protein